MKNSKLKIVICLVWAIAVLVVIFNQRSLTASGKNNELESNISKPNLKDVEEFDSLIQKRFLTEPGFGMTRIEPIPPRANHLPSYYPYDNFEQKAVNNFLRDDWKVGLYLFGKTVYKNIKSGRGQKDFLIGYRLKQPVVITNNLKKADLSSSSVILKKVKEAFSLFQESPEKEEGFEFNTGGWWYLAKPVRAVNESCVKCHSDYVVTKKLENGKYQFRPRKVGDVNGILVYAFKKVKK